MQVVAPGVALCLPGSQSKHRDSLLARVVEPNFPALQSVQFVAAVKELNVPVGQFLQLKAPFELLNVPVVQGEHAEAPAPLKLPAKQSTQVELLFAPAVLLNVPA